MNPDPDVSIGSRSLREQTEGQRQTGGSVVTSLQESATVGRDDGGHEIDKVSAR